MDERLNLGDFAIEFAVLINKNFPLFVLIALSVSLPFPFHFPGELPGAIPFFLQLRDLLYQFAIGVGETIAYLLQLVHFEPEHELLFALVVVVEQLVDLLVIDVVIVAIVLVLVGNPSHALVGVLVRLVLLPVFDEYVALSGIHVRPPFIYFILCIINADMWVSLPQGISNY